MAEVGIVGVVVEVEEEVVVVVVETRVVARAEAVGKVAEVDLGDLGRTTEEDLEETAELEAQELGLAGDLEDAVTVEVVAGNSSSLPARVARLV